MHKKWPLAIWCWETTFRVLRANAPFRIDNLIVAAHLRLINEGRFDAVRASLSSLDKQRRAKRQYLALAGVLSLRQERWDDALTAWNTHWSKAQANAFSPEDGLLRLPKNTSGNDKFLLTSPRDEKKQVPRHLPKVCIYTAVFGGYDKVREPLHKPENIDFICFSDTAQNVNGWETRIVDPALGHPNLNAKIFKILPHKYLGDYKYSLFVDANTLFVYDPAKLVFDWLYPKSFVMWRHPERSDVYDEADAILAYLRHEPYDIIEHVKFLKKENVPRSTGLVEASFIWRSHTDPVVNGLMDDWWQQILTLSKRDQLSLAYLMWKKEVRPEVLPNELGTSRSNGFFVKLPHKLLPIDVDAMKDRPASPANSEIYRQAQANVKQRIIFLYGIKHMNSGSTVMRCFQLAEVIKRYADHGISIECLSDSNVSNSVVVLSKSYLKRATAQDVVRLKDNGNLIVTDYVDDKENSEIIELSDGIMAASIAGYIYYSRRFPKKHIGLVTHHVDPRLDCRPTHINKFRAAYFGETVNTVRTPKIAELVDFIPVDTSSQETSWLDSVGHYNFHYAARETRPIDGHKPFLKGFTAAHLNSNVLVQKGHGDALFYLGQDYPYFIHGKTSEESILEALRYAKESFGSREWEYGLEIMSDVRERTSYKRVAEEFLQFVNRV